MLNKEFLHVIIGEETMKMQHWVVKINLFLVTLWMFCSYI